MASTFYEVLGDNIRTKRSGSTPAITQESLANKVGISRPSLANIERGQQRLLVDQLVAIASALNVPLMELIPEKASLEAQTPSVVETSDLPTVDEWLQVAKRG